MNKQELIPHLFRTEYRKIISVLCKHFGLEQIGMAEDIASDTFLTAAQTWPLSEIPQHPEAWLYHVAKNKAKNHLQRTRFFEKVVAVELKNTFPLFSELNLDLSLQNISDSQLQMMFAICHPCIAPEGQVALSLRILCGFGISEIADAFLTSKDTIGKRLLRAKEKLRKERVRIEWPGPSEINERLETVLTTIYLLFSEGYYSISQDNIIRKELCLEALRLAHMLSANDLTSKPQVFALLALMCFQSSRFEARLDKKGELILYDEQDTRLWNKELISQGGYFLHRATAGNCLSRYHLEATIAYWHTQHADTMEKWENILQCYDQLLQLNYSPIAALNRTYALAKVKGKRQAIQEAEKLKLTTDQFYFALLGELYTGIDNPKAKINFQQAQSLANTEADRHSLQKKINRLCESQSDPFQGKACDQPLK